LEELDRIAQKRKIELIVGPEYMFSSPEKTWETYKKALTAGNMDLGMECHIPGNNKYREIFSRMGKDKMKKIAENMNPIKKIQMGEQRAEYLITRKEYGNTIAYTIYFSNINGEWKIDRY
jgi:hypothetical protein